MTTRMKGIFVSVALIVIALVMLPFVVTSSFDASNDRQADAFPGCVVAAGATDVVLTEDLTADDTTYVITITATGVGAVPVAGVYTAGTNSLNVTGLGADTPQDLTVTYWYGVVDDYNGVEAIVGLIPLLVVVGIIIVAIINGLWAMKKGD